MQPITAKLMTLSRWPRSSIDTCRGVLRCSTAFISDTWLGEREGRKRTGKTGIEVEGRRANRILGLTASKVQEYESNYAGRTHLQFT